MKEKAFNLCREFLGGAWKKISCNDMIFERLSGGLTNLLYYCELPKFQQPVYGEPNKLLLRLYGKIHEDGTGDAVVKENVIFMLLSERRLGPKLYGIFSGGRLEEYIPVPSLKRTQLSDSLISSYIAQKLAQVHNVNAPINKEPVFMYNTGIRWLKSINTMVNRKPESEEERLKFNHLKSHNLEPEYKWLWSILKKVNSPVVFSHNDVQEGNILYNTKAVTDIEKLIFIDFEFCGYNYRAFDFANHFLEWTYGYEIKTAPYYEVLPEDYPSREQQLKFIRSYLKASQRTLNGRVDVPVDNDDDREVTTEEEETFLFEIEVFVLAVHMFWTLWGYMNANTAKILFGYWDFAEHRLEAYFKHKELLLEINSKFAELVKDLE